MYHTSTEVTRAGEAITIRPAASADDAALTRLAQLDSAAPPIGRYLVAAVDGEIKAALSLRDGSAISDPFARTAELVEMLRLSAGAASPRPRRRRRHLAPQPPGTLRPADSW